VTPRQASCQLFSSGGFFGSLRPQGGVATSVRCISHNEIEGYPTDSIAGRNVLLKTLLEAVESPTASSS
jgi:hypothetical protein